MTVGFSVRAVFENAITPWASRLALIAAILAAVIAASVFSSSDPQLPDVALRWPALFHVERAVALVGLLGGSALIGWRATHGEFPIGFGNLLSYAEKEESALTLDTLTERIDTLQALVADLLADETRRE